MSLSEQYLNATGVDSSTYSCEQRATQRIEEIYRSVRNATIRNKQLSPHIWKILKPIYDYWTTKQKKLPPGQQEYDKQVVDLGFEIKSIFPQQQDYDKYDKQVVDLGYKIQSVLKEGNATIWGFGVGQKIVNLFMKDLWALGIIQNPYEKLLHAPLDRIVLEKIKNVPSTWNAWTKVIAENKKSVEIKDYLRLQKGIRDFHQKCPIKFQSVIQMEQFIWHRIEME